MKLPSRSALTSIATFVSFVLLATAVVLLAQGYRFDGSTAGVTSTGIIVVESVPTGATVSLNGAVRGASNTTLSTLPPGSYDLSLAKDGYATWSKTVTVERNKVVSIGALLIPVNPSLSPLSSTPVTQPVLSPDQQRLAYTVTQGSSAGVWVLDMTDQPFNFGGRRQSQLVADTESERYSGMQIRWSPTGRDVLLSRPEGGASYRVAIDNPSGISPVPSSAELLQSWVTEASQLQNEYLADVPEDIATRITASPVAPLWSFDRLKVLYAETVDGQRQYRIYNREAKVDYQTYAVARDGFAVLRWFGDSQHVIVLEKQGLDAPTGTVSVMGMDGTNRFQAFSGTTIGDALYSFANGSQLVIVTSFNVQSPSYYLYSINLR